MNFNKDKISCSLCPNLSNKQKIYTNSICNHSYCSECICRIHIPDQDKMKCLVYNCKYQIIINDLDDYFFRQQFEMINSQDFKDSRLNQSLQNDGYGNFISQPISAQNQIDSKNQSSKIQSVYQNKLCTDDKNYLNQSKVESNKQEPSKPKIAITNTILHQESQPISNKQIEPSKSQVNFQDEYQHTKSNLNSSNARKLSELRPINIKETDKFCAKCLKFLDEPQQILQINQCKKHQLCFGCQNLDIRKGGYNCDICDRWIQ